jgi:hypothetical protein
MAGYNGEYRLSRGTPQVRSPVSEEGGPTVTESSSVCEEQVYSFDGKWVDWNHAKELHALIASLRAELEELSKKHNCGEEPCAWVGGFCNHHAVEYYRCLEKERDELRELLKEFWVHLEKHNPHHTNTPCWKCGFQERVESALQRGKV